MAIADGDLLVVDLQEAGATAAEVISARDGFAGCRFEGTLSKAAISAGQLQSPPADMPYSIPFTQPKVVAARPCEPAVEVEDGLSLILAIATALVLVVALLNFPFATR